MAAQDTGPDTRIGVLGLKVRNFVADLVYLASVGVPVRKYLDGSMAEAIEKPTAPKKTMTKPRKKREPSGFGKVKV